MQNSKENSGKKPKPQKKNDYSAPSSSKLREITGYHEKKGKPTKITQSQLADAIGVTRQTVSDYLLGNTQPNAEVITKIAQYFNVSSDYLLGITKAKTPLHTDKQNALRIAADFTELNESLINLIHTLSKNGNSVVNDLIGIIVEEYCFHIKLIEELKNSTERDLPNKIANLANRCENEETAKEVIWDAENEFNQNLAYKYLIENSLITAINKYFRFDDIQEKYKEFLDNKEKILERFKVSENEQKES